MRAVNLDPLNEAGRPDPAALQALGFQGVRMVPRNHDDSRDWYAGWHGAGLPVLLVLTKDTFSSYGVDVDQPLESWDVESVVSRVLAEHPAPVGVSCGNEPEGGESASWTLGPEKYLAFHNRCATVLRSRGVTVCTAGLSSGQPAWLDAIVDRLSFDVLLIHPYAKTPEQARELIWEYKSLLSPGQRWGASEWHRGEVEEVGPFIQMMEEEGAWGHWWYAWSDGMTKPFGLYDTAGRRKVALWTAMHNALSAPYHGPTEPLPIPEVPVSHPWEYWSAEQIAKVTKCPVAAIRENWPKIYEALAAHHINGRLEQMAALATVAIETASTFEPVREAFWMSEEWRRDNLRYYPYFGRGYIQLTWLDNYDDYGRVLGWDLKGNPDLALDPHVAAMVLARYFVDRQVADAAAAQDWPEVRRRVQGGHAGLDRLQEIVAALGATVVQPAPEPEPILEPQPEPPARLHPTIPEAALLDLWRAGREVWPKDVEVPFDSGLGICRFWAASPYEFGSPLGPERAGEGGTAVQAFSRAGIRWSDGKAEKVA